LSLPLFCENGVDAGYVPAERTQHVRLFQLARLLLNPQVENFLPHFAFARLEFFDGEFLNLGDFHSQLFRGAMA
jgi:hypothetical protein